MLIGTDMDERAEGANAALNLGNMYDCMSLRMSALRCVSYALGKI
jgi:hypothetical protein